jgi:hypothetical protein
VQFNFYCLIAGENKKEAISALVTECHISWNTAGMGENTLASFY